MSYICVRSRTAFLAMNPTSNVMQYRLDKHFLSFFFFSLLLFLNALFSDALDAFSLNEWSCFYCVFVLGCDCLTLWTEPQSQWLNHRKLYTKYLICLFNYHGARRNETIDWGIEWFFNTFFIDNFKWTRVIGI